MHGSGPYKRLAACSTSASALCCRIEEIDGQKVGGRDPERIARIQKAAWNEALEEVRQIKG